MKLFDINNILTSIFGYQLSYVEFIGVTLGLVSVWFAAKQNIATWSTGLINILCAFAIFYQVRLYSDMFLQIYFFFTSIYGWINWKKLKQIENPISALSGKQRLLWITIIVISTAMFGSLVKNIHLMFPKVFVQPASFPFTDTFIAVSSIIATMFLAKRIVENWVLWIIVDIIAVFIYLKKHILFISFEYAIFFLLAFYGLHLWLNSIKNENRFGVR